MSTILNDFARGNMIIKPPLDPNSERADNIEFVNDLEKELLGRLNGKDKALFENIVNTYQEIIELTAIENRIHGYKLGVMMAAEVFVTGHE